MDPLQMVRRYHPPRNIYLACGILPQIRWVRLKELAGSRAGYRQNARGIHQYLPSISNNGLHDQPVIVVRLGMRFDAGERTGRPFG